MIIQHNISAQNSRRKLSENAGEAAKSLSKLSSGFRINSAADDAASLAISEKMRHQVTGLEAGTNNINQGKALSQIGDGALEEVHAMLRRAYELAGQSANGTYTDEERPILEQEISHILREIDRVAKYTQVNGHFPLNFDETIIQSGASSPSRPSDNIWVDFDKIELGAFLNENAALSNTGHMNLAGVTNDTYTGAQQQWNLVYGNGGTSHTKLRLYTDDPNATPIELDLNDSQLVVAGSYVTSSNPPAYSLTYQYSKDLATGTSPAPDTTDPVNLLKIEITKKITVNPKATDGNSQHYTIAYEVANKNTAVGAPNISYDFMHQFDTAYNNDDQVERYYIDGERVEDSVILGQNTNPPSTLPEDGFSIWGPTSQLSFTGNVKYEDGSKPDYLFLGHWSSETPQWDYIDHPDTLHRPLTPGTDLGFSMVWDQVGFNPDGTSNKKMELQFGIVSKDKDVNIDVDDPDLDTEIEPKPVETIESPGIWIQSGVEADEGFYLRCCKATVKDLELESVSIVTVDAANSAMQQLKSAINQVSVFRGDFGADQNRLTHAESVNQAVSENLTASESSIRDVDMAKEYMKYVKTNILTQASQAMLAQAGQMSQGVLQLLK